MSTPDWDLFDPTKYLDANYRSVLEADREICLVLAETYGRLVDEGRRSLVVLDAGTGPNLYPLIAALPVAERIDCGDFSTPNTQYLLDQLRHPSANWGLFADVMAEVHPVYRTLPWSELLARRVSPHRVDVYTLPRDTYDVVSSFFVAESITTERGHYSSAPTPGAKATFAESAASLVHALKPGGMLIMALMAGSTGYDTAGQDFPATPVTVADVRAALLAAGCPDPHVRELAATVREGHAGMFLVTAQRPVPSRLEASARARSSLEILHIAPHRIDREQIAERIKAMQALVHPATVADSSVLVLIDDVNLRTRPARLHKAIQAAADAVAAACLAAGVLVDAVFKESDLVPAADELAAMLDPDRLADGVLTVTPHWKSDPSAITLWTDHNGTRSYSCPMVSAAWAMFRMGLVHAEIEPAHRLSTRPIQAKVNLAALDAEYIHVEATVRAILMALTPSELGEAVIERLGWVFVPTAASSATDGPSEIGELVPSEGDVWQRLDADLYVQQNYGQLLPVDDYLARTLDAFLAGHDGADVVDIGAGGNLYPSIAAATRCRSLVAWEYAPVFCRYLEAQYAHPDAMWEPFAALMGAPPNWPALIEAKGRIVQGSVLDIPPASFDVATMFFVADCADATWAGFCATVAGAVRSLRPGGRLFMVVTEGSQPARYGDVVIPMLALSAADVRSALQAARAQDIDVQVHRGEQFVYREGLKGIMVATCSRPGLAPALETTAGEDHDGIFTGR